MFLLLAIPLWCGFELARRVLREPSRAGAAVVGLGLAIALTLLGVNGVYRFSTLDRAVASTLVAELLLTLAVLRLPRPQSAAWSWSPLTWVSLVLIYLFTASQQIANPDDDYWIHTPLQGLMLHGNFPPFNPFFSEIPMNGHYGRNLSLVTVAYLSGLDTFLVQHLMTCVAQLLTYLLLLLALERHTGSRPQALLGATLMYFGINVGGRGGLMDTLQNNNAYVNLYLALCLHLCLSVWRRAGGETGSPLRGAAGGETGSPLRGAAGGETWVGALLAGTVLGGYAIVYETHFGLTILAIVCAFPLAWWTTERRARRTLLLRTLLLLAVALPLAATQGGPITNIVQRKLSGHKEVGAESLSKGMQNQSQVVKLTVPKRHFLQILLETGEYQRISCIYSLDTFMHAFYSPSPGRGYAFIFSWDVLKLHFLPLYLSPWSCWFLWRRRNVAGFWLWSWGMISFLVPAVVDFGPIYESEYFRWQFAAGVGLAGALGTAMGQVWEDSRRELDWTYETRPGGLVLEIRRGGWQQLAIGALLVLDTLACSHLLSDRFRLLSSRGWLHQVNLLPSTEKWLRSHAVLDFPPIDWRAARWLERRIEPGHRLLTNFRQENNFSILFESTLTGVCGARCVGHALPLDEEAIGTTPYHQAAPAAAYWETGDRNFLDQLLVDWIYYRPTAERPQLTTEGLELVHTETDGVEQRLIYRYQRRPLVLSSVPMDLPAGLQVTAVDWPEAVRGGEYRPLKLRISETPLESGARLAVVPVQVGSEKVPAEVELVQIPLDEPRDPIPPPPGKGEPREVQLPWVTPFEEGQYRLQFLYRTPRGQARIPSPPATVAVNFAAWLKELQVESVDLPSRGGVGELVLSRFVLRSVEGRDYHDWKVLGCLAAVHLNPEGVTAVPDVIHRGELPGDLYALPGINLQELLLKPQPAPPLAGARLDVGVAGVLPSKPGRYRLDLFLSPEQGKLFRYPGKEIEVKP